MIFGSGGGRGGGGGGSGPPVPPSGNAHVLHEYPESVGVADTSPCCKLLKALAKEFQRLFTPTNRIIWSVGALW